MRRPIERTRREFLKAGGACVAASVAMSRAAVGGPGAEAPRRPNLLVFIPDQQRHDWVQMNPGVPVPTPHLAALAARGVHFKSALTPSPICGPARACLASGVEYARCGVTANGQPYPRGKQTHYELLRDAGGYHVMSVGKLDLASDGWGKDGKNNMRAWGFSDMVNTGGKAATMRSYRRHGAGSRDPYCQYLEAQDPPMAGAVFEDLYARVKGRDPELAMGSVEPVTIDDRHYFDNWVARQGLQLLDAAPDEKPWYLVVNFPGPHFPNDVTTRMAGLYRGPERVIDGFPPPNRYEGQMSAAVHLACRQNYSAMVENIDRWLGLYAEELDARGELDNTIIVYTSDHGEMLGDHGTWGKSVPYQAAVGVPMVVAGPAIRSGLSTTTPMSLIDLAATFLDYAGVPVPGDMDSRSARSLLSGETQSHREHAYSAFGNWRLVHDGRYKLVQGFGDETLLFDLEADPFENENLATKAADHLARLRKQLTDGN